MEVGKVTISLVGEIFPAGVGTMVGVGGTVLHDAAAVDHDHHRTAVGVDVVAEVEEAEVEGETRVQVQAQALTPSHCGE